MLLRKTEVGITVLELAITMTVSGIMLAMSIPAVGLLLQSNNLNQGLEQAAGHLRLARQTAAATGFPQLVVWNPSDFSYQIVEDQNANNLADSAEQRMGPYKLPKKVTVDAAHTELTGNWIRFSPDGSASQSGLLTLNNERGRSVSLLLIGATGQIKLNK